MSSKIFKETYDTENGDHDLIACEIVTCCLEIPGVKEAVMTTALDKWGEDSLRWLRNEQGVERLEDIPFQYIWDYIFNQEEALQEVKV